MTRTAKCGMAETVKKGKGRAYLERKEHMLITRDGNVIKGPRFEKMIQTLIH